MHWARLKRMAAEPRRARGVLPIMDRIAPPSAAPPSAAGSPALCSPAAFDRFAERWDAEHGPASPRAREFAARRRLLRGLCAGRRPRVLEIGCGTGMNLIGLADLIRAGLGVDFSPAMIDRARRNAAAHGASGLAFRVGDAIACDTGPEPFDLILMAGVLEHLPAPDRALAACRSRLAPGGRVVIVAPHRDNPAFLWRRLALRQRPEIFAGDRHLTPRGLAALAGRQGLVRIGLHALPVRPGSDDRFAPPVWLRPLLSAAAAVPLPALRGGFGMVLRAGG